jgi:hypothetical protein
VERVFAGLEFRLIESSQAMEVSRCIYRTYGGSYEYENAYFPLRFVEFDETELMTSVVAMAEGGEVPGGQRPI